MTGGLYTFSYTKYLFIENNQWQRNIGALPRLFYALLCFTYSVILLLFGRLFQDHLLLLLHLLQAPAPPHAPGCHTAHGTPGRAPVCLFLHLLCVFHLPAQTLQVAYSYWARSNTSSPLGLSSSALSRMFVSKASALVQSFLPSQENVLQLGQVVSFSPPVRCERRNCSN